MEIPQKLSEIIAYLQIEAWMFQVFLIVFVALFVDYVQKRLNTKLQEKLQKSTNFWDDALLEAARGPASLFIWLIGLAFAADIIRAESDATIFDAVDPVRQVGVVTLVAWFFVRFIRLAENNILAKQAIKGKPVDRTTADAIAKLLRISVVITAFLVVLQTLGYSISGVLAFGGISGIAVGFAAKDLLSNFFGGLMIYMDRPFAVGEWIRSPDREIEGTVEEIGWRLTRIRTFDKRPLYVPNAVFTTITVENPARMTNRRIYETVGIRYDDAGKMSVIIEEVRAMLLAHPEIDTEQTLIVNFNKFAASSLDFFIYTFTKTTKWVRYHEIKQDVLLRVIEIIGNNGAECAFPTSTLHIPQPVSIEQHSD